MVGSRIVRSGGIALVPLLVAWGAGSGSAGASAAHANRGPTANSTASHHFAAGQGPLRAASSSYVETNVQNPVVAAPPISRPPTKSCSVSLASDFPSNAANGSPQNFTGLYQPPANCKGPWSKVILTFHASVKGRQYDRSASIMFGNTTIWFGTTMEPDPRGLSWTTTKDVTEYSQLFESSQNFSGGIGNYTNSTDTGVYVQTATLTFYQATKRYPAPVEPSQVVGLGAADVDAADNSTTFKVSNLPTNAVRAELEIYIKGNGCDEQWFSSVPTNIADKYPNAGFCPNGPYREVDATIDAKPAGVVQYFPYIYTGGIVPTLWRPIPAIGTFDLSPETLDVTPLVADLDRSGSHSFTLSVPEANDVWNLEANLLLWTDSGAKVITGHLISDTVAPSADVHVKESTPSSNKVDAVTNAYRTSVLSGWVMTPKGRVTTVVRSHSDFSNAETVTTNGLYEELTQSDKGAQYTHTTGAGQNWTATQYWSYPLHVVENVVSYTDDNNFDLTGTVDMTRDQAYRARGQGITNSVTFSEDQLSSSAEEARSNGVDTVADGHSSEVWVGPYQGDLWKHRLTADHGYVTSNRIWAYGPPPPGWMAVGSGAWRKIS